MAKRSNKEMLNRMTDFGIRVCKVTNNMPSTTSGHILARQVIRSSTSIGANYQEAQRSRTTKEFLSKLHIALQEAEETTHWLKTLHGCSDRGNEEIRRLINENSELIAILVASINTTRRRSRLP